ncbi:MAG: two-component system OmpR family sensor kinase [Methylophagaceae bacterium]|jgi:two-component system OmpR family sensor kinase
MGRLFWKIFFGFWLTILVTGTTAGWLVWHHANDHIAHLEILVDHPKAGHNLNKVAQIIAEHGVEGIGSYMTLREKRKKHPLPMFIVNEANEDFLGRSVPKILLEKVQQLLKTPNHSTIKQVVTPAGEKLLLFIPRRDHPIMQRGQLFPTDLPLLSLLVLLLGSLFFSAGLAFYLTRPLHHLRGATQRFAAGDLDSRVMDKMAGRRDEIVDLAADFDQMAEQVQQLIGSQQRLLNDVSHELRSPLARLQLAVALGRKQPEQFETMMQRLEKESQRLDTLVGELLTLSRLEAAEEDDDHDYFDVMGLVSLICSDAAFEANEQGKKVYFKVGPEYLLNGNIELLRRAVENIIRNAVFHTAENTTVTVEITSVETDIILTVSDEGKGVEEQALSQLFLPFVRFGHQQNSDIPGYGLGLAIAARAVALHKGSVNAENRTQGGLCIKVILPLV